MGELRRIHWTSPARFDLRRLRAWTERHSPAKASVQARRIREAVESLSGMPRLGRTVAVPDGGSEELRELILPPYVIRYVVEPKRILIIRLWHGREDRPAGPRV